MKESFLSIVRHDRGFLRRYVGIFLGVIGFGVLIAVGGWLSYSIASANRTDQETTSAMGLQKALSQQIASEILLVQKEWRDSGKLNERSFASLSEARTAFDAVLKGFSEGAAQELTFGGRRYTAPRLHADSIATLDKIRAAWAPLRAQLDVLGQVYKQAATAKQSQSERDKFIAGRKTFITEIHEDNKDSAFPNDNLSAKFVPTRRMTAAHEVLLNAEITKTSNTLTTYKDELFKAVDALSVASAARIQATAQRNAMIQIGIVAAGAVLLALLLSYFLRRTIVTDYVAHKESTEKRAIFSTIAEGLLVMDSAWRVSGEPSAFMTKLFGQQIPVGASFSSILAKAVDADTMRKAQEFVAFMAKNRTAKASQLQDANPLKQVALNLPGAGTKHVSFTFERLIDERNRVAGLLVAVQDSTQTQKLTAELEQAQARNRSSLTALAALRRTTQRNKIVQMLAELRKVVTLHNERIRSAGTRHAPIRESLRELRSAAHNFKAQAGMLDVVILQYMLHEFEDELILLSNLEVITADAVLGKGVLGQSILDMVDMIETILPRPATEAQAPAPATAIRSTLATVAQKAAAESGKKVNLTFTDAGIAATPAYRRLNGQLEEILVQLVSNAVVHGIEPPQVRVERRKAEAGTISIAGVDTGAGIEITVRDDGAGFDPQAVQGGRGLKNLARRAREIGAELAIDSAPGAGARVVVQWTAG